MTARKRPLRIPVMSAPEEGRSKVAESTDPYLATAVAMPTPGHDGMALMARTFVEEFARMGWPREKIGRMFRIPRYVAAHAVYQQRGPSYVEALIDEVLGPAPTDGEDG